MRLAQPDNEIGPRSLRNGDKGEWNYKNLGMRIREDGIGKGEVMDLEMKD